MKTKSKRFLKLATLCLALLGTTLLTTQPVKAEGSDSHSGKRVTSRRQFKTYGDGYKVGYEEGYKEGSKEDAPEHPEDNPNVQKNEDYNPSNVGDPYDGYTDGFDSGYAKGWHQVNDGGDSHHQESQDRKKAQDRVGESTEKSHDEESQDNHKTPSEEENSTDGSTVSSLLSEIVGIFLDFVLYWF
ncbi:hypothetical protein [Streptococcus pyogenes]|uniref:hypothetical protein n=1 Tax=Streptococcus pyogenes TaxID=1314 RepID=UPI0010A1752C|nr:hypothetical protein [Streptococcus pyogenes]VHC74746.1 Uncharacterised protein [Streptococcus pyogenes]